MSDTESVHGVAPDWHADVVTSDGRTVHLRPISPQDEDQLLALNDRISDQTVYFRFFSYRRTPSDAEVARLVNVDHRDRVALVAEDAGTLIGIGRYDRTDPGVAEVAFLVEDAHQGRGIGTLLLEHLAVWGRRNGIERFTAYTLPENRKMLGVFRSAGFRAERRFVDGLVEIEFPITHIDPEPLEQRDQQADAASIARILNPSVVAVVGASRDPDSIGHHLLRNILNGGFSGVVHAVNPSAESVAGIRAYPSVAQLPDAVDLAVVAVPATEVPAVVTECAAAGVHAALIVSAGIGGASRHDGALAEAVTEEAHRLGMRMIGPGSFGIINNDPGVRLQATFGTEVPPAGPLGLMSQSGMLAVTAMRESADQGVGISSFVSAGARLDVSGNDLLHYWASDPTTRVIGLYLEDFGNPRRFSRIARRVSAVKPIVAIAGRSDDDEIVEALFRQTGVIRVATLPELVDVARVLSSCPPMLGSRVLVVSNEGGAGQMCASALRSGALVAAKPTAPTVAAIIELGGFLAGEVIEIPFDATTETWSEVLRLGLADDDVDAVIVSHHEVADGRRADVPAAVAAAADHSEGKPLLASLLDTRANARTISSNDGSIEVPVFEIPEIAAMGLARAARHADWRLRRLGSFVEVDTDALLAAQRWADAAVAGGPVTLDGDVVAPLLARFGLEIGPGADDIGDVTPVLHVGIDNHPGFGPLVTASLGLGRDAIRAKSHVRLAPLSDTDAAALLRNLPGLNAFATAPEIEHPALIDMLCRLGLLAAEVEQVSAASMGPISIATPSGLGTASVTLRPTTTDWGLDARQLS